jgi:hypothetical protein
MFSFGTQDAISTEKFVSKGGRMNVLARLNWEKAFFISLAAYMAVMFTMA